MKYIFGTILWSFFVTLSQAYEWVPFENGTFPSTGFYDPHGLKNYYFCRVRDGANKWVGTANNIDQVCDVPMVEKQTVEAFKDFDVFALSPGETVIIKYSEFAEPPKNAIKCEDSSIPNCYLGHSIYGDGICWKMIGKVDPDRAIVVYETPMATYEDCTFVSFITVV